MSIPLYNNNIYLILNRIIYYFVVFIILYSFLTKNITKYNNLFM